MQVAIAGSRGAQTFSPSDLEQAILDTGWTIHKVLVTGGTGVSVLAVKWAQQRDLEVEVHLPDPTDLRKISAVKRNVRMAETADALICLHDGSKGAWSLMQEFLLRDKPVYEVQRNWEQVQE